MRYYFHRVTVRSPFHGQTEEFTTETRAATAADALAHLRRHFGNALLTVAGIGSEA